MAVAVVRDEVHRGRRLRIARHAVGGHALGARTVVLKLGKAGAVLSTPSSRKRIAGHAVRAVDATGAGDCFAGSLLARLAAGDAIAQAVRYANAAAALMTTGFGAVAPIPRPEEVRNLLARVA